MNDTNLEPWKLQESKYIINDRWLKVKSNTYKTPTGHTIDPYYVIESDDWINCFVIDGLEVIMVNHYRPAADVYLPELVSGGIEPTDASPQDAMRRELEEEIGYTGGELHQTGVSYANPARQNNKIYSFIAFGGRCDLVQRLEDGESLQIMRMPFKELLEMLEDKSTVHQSTHLAAIFFALNFLRESASSELQELKTVLEGFYAR